MSRLLAKGFNLLSAWKSDVSPGEATLLATDRTGRTKRALLHDPIQHAPPYPPLATFSVSIPLISVRALRPAVNSLFTRATVNFARRQRLISFRALIRAVIKKKEKKGGKIQALKSAPGFGVGGGRPFEIKAAGNKRSFACT